MTLRMAEPPLEGLLALFSVSRSRIAKPGATKIYASAALLQAARSEAIGYFDGDRLIAAAMFYPLPPDGDVDCYELAFVCRPELARNLKAFVRLAHRTRDAVANNGPVRIIARVHAGHRPGARLAVLSGMHLAGRDGAFERWEFEGKSNVTIR